MTSTGHAAADSQQGPTEGQDRDHRTARATVPLTMGVEEEYLLVDPVSRAVAPEAEKVLAEAVGELGDQITPEITRYQIEARSAPHTSLAELGEQVRSTRTALARVAARQGLRIVSSGTPVFGQAAPTPLSPGARYARSAERFGALDDEQSACACHVHIGVPGLSEALRVSNHLRPWIPALIALTANSPYWAGQDTGHASWRTTTWGRWPVAGPPPYFESAGHFEDLVGGFLATGVLMDRGGLYWDIRPSHHLPTLEFRMADATTTADETVLLAGLVRAMVATALRAVEAGEPAPRPASELLRAACWRAARVGLAGEGIDVRTGRLAPGTAMIGRLLAWVGPALLEHGDTELVHALWTRVETAGTGADRQRAAYRHRAELADVVDHLITATAPLPGERR
ncbi:glutamate--cysteine ligase [Streptomyces roseoviridis]|uniref:Putative glutamate--cysteine ligase 2 n=2 Tax=Streptomyces roseoviridis TaxID=67361 RepID=A0ABV5QZP4_9ACTN